MLVRHINSFKWREGLLFMKRNDCKEAVVEEKYLYKEKTDNFLNLSEQVVEKIWFHAIFVIETKPHKVTCLLGPEFAWRSRLDVLRHVRANPQLWLEQEELTFPAEPTPRPRIINDWLERAAWEQALSAPDAVSLSGL